MENKLWIYTKKCFPLELALPLTLCFALSNAMVALFLLGEEQASVIRFLVICFLGVSFFYRYFLFTAIREFEEPSEFRLDSPIEKGLITKELARNIAFSLIGVELLLTAFMGLASFVAHLFPITFSLLIYRHFFCKNWLCSHQWFYVFLRSIVLVLVGFSISVTISEHWLFTLPVALYLFGFVNWATLTIHEFGKKDKIYGSNSSQRVIWGSILLMSLISMFLFSFLTFLGAAIFGMVLCLAGKALYSRALLFLWIFYTALFFIVAK